ncbi:MAG TPA: ABC transporter ATP-binding protein, partial [Ignavibacteriaceae bacterium]
MNTYKRILKYVFPYWKRLILIFILSALYAVLNGLSIYLIIPLLDTLFQEGKTTQTSTTQQIEKTTSLLPDFINDAKESVSDLFTSFVYTGDKIDILLKICFVILLVFFLKNLFGYLQTNLMSYVEYSSMNDLRDAAYKHLHKLPIGYFKKEKVGNLISRFTNDVNKIQDSISATFSNLIKEPLTIIVFLIIALSISWQLTLFALIILPLSMLAILWIGLKVRKQSTVVQRKMADITSVLQETISGVKVVKAFGMEEYENKKFLNETRIFLKEIVRIVKIRNATSPLTEMISILVGAIIIYYGGTLVLQSATLTASLFMGFLLAILQMMRPIKDLSTVNTKIQEASAAADRIFEILDTVPDIVDSENAKTLESFKTNINFNDVCFKYEDSEEWVLNKINFDVRRGDILALVGPSGGGKSTLVDLIPRFYDPTSGSIVIDNEDIRNYS